MTTSPENPTPEYGVTLLGPAVLTGVDTPEAGGTGTRTSGDAVLLDAPAHDARAIFAGPRAMMLLLAYPASTGEETAEGETGIVISLKMWASHTGRSEAPQLSWESTDGAVGGSPAVLGESLSQPVVEQALEYLSKVHDEAQVSASLPTAEAARAVESPLREALTLLAQDPGWAAVALGTAHAQNVRTVEVPGESQHQAASRQALSDAKDSLQGKPSSVRRPHAGAATWRSRWPIAAFVFAAFELVLAVVVLIFTPLTIAWTNYLLAFVLGLDAIVGVIAGVQGLKSRRDERGATTHGKDH